MSAINLTAHWKTVKIEEIADVRGGSSFPKPYQGNTKGQYPFYKVSDMNLVGNEVRMHASNNWIEEKTVKTLRAKLFLKGTVIFPKVGAAVHTNKKRILSSEGLVDNNVMGIAVRDYNLCIPYFLLYWLESVDLVDFSNPGPLPSITATRVKNSEIPLPPLPEQRAIASVLGAIQEAKFARQKEIALERERKAALMEYLFSHGTKGEPRKQTEIGEIPERWEVVRLTELCTKITDGTHRTPTYVKKGVPFLRVVDIQSTNVDWQQVKWIPRNEHEELIKRCKPEKGDVLLSKNGTIGKTKVVDWEQEFSIFVSLCLLKVKHKLLNNVYLAEFLASKGLPQIQKRGKRMTVTNLHLVEIRELLIPLPSLSEQQEIAETLQTCDNKIAALEQETNRLDELFHAMLEELMTGKRSATPLIDLES